MEFSGIQRRNNSVLGAQRFVPKVLTKLGIKHQLQIHSGHGIVELMSGKQFHKGSTVKSPYIGL